MARRSAGVITTILAIALWVGASAPASAASPQPSGSSPSASSDPLRMVVIGDSIPFAAFCPGCTGFVDLYAADLEARTARPVIVANRSRDDSAGIPEIQTQVTEDESLRNEIEGADVVIVSVGFNNVLPDPATGIGCLGDGGDTVESYTLWLLATTAECRQSGRDTYAEAYDDIFSTITELRGGAPTSFIALNVHDGNKNNSDVAAADLPEATKESVEQLFVPIYDDWNAMLCDRAARAGFACVDVYHAFNGPTGENPSGSWTVDGAHPSQAGNRLIADLLAQLDVAPITG